MVLSVPKATRVGADTMLSQIVEMVSNAQRSRAPIQRLADRVAGWFVPAVIAAALVAFGAWALFGPEPRLAFGLVAAVSVLIIACPCALVISTPVTVVSALAAAAPTSSAPMPASMKTGLSDTWIVSAMVETVGA